MPDDALTLLEDLTGIIARHWTAIQTLLDSLERPVTFRLLSLWGKYDLLVYDLKPGGILLASNDTPYHRITEIDHLQTFRALKEDLDSFLLSMKDQSHIIDIRLDEPSFHELAVAKQHDRSTNA